MPLRSGGVPRLLPWRACMLFVVLTLRGCWSTTWPEDLAVDGIAAAERGVTSPSAPERVALSDATGTPPPPSSAHSTPTSPSTTADAGPCPAAAACFRDANCTACVRAVADAVAVPSVAARNALSLEAVKAAERRFARAVLATPECPRYPPPGAPPPPDADKVYFFYAGVLAEITAPNRCSSAFGVAVGKCAGGQFVCSATSSCRPCLAAIIERDPGASARSVLDSAACANVPRNLRDFLTVECNDFPQCEIAKLVCVANAECALCLEAYARRNVAAAARRCAGVTPGSPGVLLDRAVDFCDMATEDACEFHQRRCLANAECSSCAAGVIVRGDLDARSAAFAAADPRCVDAFGNPYVNGVLSAMAINCPGARRLSKCGAAVWSCAMANPRTCAACVLDANGTRGTDECRSLLSSSGYGVDAACERCPASVAAVNTLVFATATVGGASAFACLAVVAVVVANGRDRAAVRDRIIVGLMLANTVYSCSNAIPLNLLRTAADTCGQLSLSFATIRVGRGLWFWGKFSLVGFEMFVVAASARALHIGSRGVSFVAEVAMHVSCAALGAAAFAWFYVACAQINHERGYNRATQLEGVSGAIAHMSADDDVDDDMAEASSRAQRAFTAGRDDYDGLVRDMLISWDVLLALVVLAWVWLRLVFRREVTRWGTRVEDTSADEAADPWRDTRSGGWLAHRELLAAERRGYNDVASPLAPFVWVFLLFAAPAVVMSTEWCQDRSRVHTQASIRVVASSSNNSTFATCDVWCEFALAFRSLATVIVFLRPEQRRREMADVGGTCRKLVIRFAAMCSRRADESASPGGEEEIELATLDSLLRMPLASWCIGESDVSADEIIGEGSFAVVWRGKWQQRNVAVKILRPDAVTAFRSTDFARECDALSKVKHPNVLRFCGFGVFKTGEGFIVTELLAGGSLQTAILDKSVELPWKTRVSVALQVASGLAHLHSLSLVHRDLKSANVLLDGAGRAVVADLGLSRRLRPLGPRLVVSPFTGEVYVVGAGGDGAPLVDPGVSLPVDALRNARVAVLDAQGALTEATGTLLWMAPELFRGDNRYGKAVDVFSFGVLMWELASRRVPWDELSTRTVGVRSNVSDIERFCVELERALQSGRRPVVPGDVANRHRGYVLVMRLCWQGDPVHRPSCETVAALLARVLRDMREEERLGADPWRRE